MSDLPEPIVAALRDHGAGEVIDAMVTHGRHPLGPLGEQVLAPLWVVVTDTRVLLVAATDDHAWVRASGEPDAIELDRGWIQDDIVVNGHRLGIAATGRRHAVRLVEAWAAATRGGPRIVPPGLPEVPDGRSPAARGVGLDDDLVGNAPGDPDARWLHVVETAAEHHVPGADGRPRSADIVVLVSDRHAIAIARHPTGEVGWRPLDGPLALHRTRTRSSLQHGDLLLPLPRLRGGSAELAVALSTLDPAGRWAATARDLFERQRVRRAASLWSEAVALGHATTSWPDIARAAWVAAESPTAHAALVQALTGGGLAVGDHDAWAAPVATWQRAAGRPQAAAAALATTLLPAVEALGTPPPPTALPQPPSDERELWIGALLAAEQPDAADALAEGLDETPRGLEVRAALLAAHGRPDAKAWRSAAHAWHGLGELTPARRCLEHALRLQPEPTDRWRAGAWAWEDDARQAARTWWVEALEHDPQGTHLPLLADAEAWRTLAAIAEHAEALPLAVRCWRAVHASRPDDAQAAWALADLLADGLGDRAAAADVLAVAATRLEDRADASRRPSEAWLRVAALREGPDVQDALRNAVAADFLHRDAWRAALDRRDDLPPVLAAWWAHVGRVVVGDELPEAAPPDPPTWLSPDDIDALHPGGIAWLDAVRQQFEGATPPDRDLLVTGLERLERGWPEAQADLEDLCAALRLPVPDAFLYRGEGAWGVSAWPTEPPLLLVGDAHRTDGPRHLAGAARRFALATELAHLAAGHPLLDVDTTLAGAGRSLYRAFGRYAGAAENAVDLVALVPGIDHLARIERLLRVSRKVFAARHAIDKASDLAQPMMPELTDRAATVRGLGREGLQGAALQNRLHAERVALVLVGDLSAAVEAILRTSTTALPSADRVRESGVAALIADPESGLTPDETLRIVGLVAFAALQGPFGRRRLAR